MKITNAKPTHPKATTNPVTVSFFVFNSLFKASILEHVDGTKPLSEAVGDGISLVVLNKVTVALQIGSPAPMFRVLFPLSQQARESLVCPQQNVPYGPQGVMTASASFRSSTA